MIKGIKEPLYRYRIHERLGIIPKIPVPVIWIHCASIGEFKAANALIDTLIQKFTDYRILITTVTATGSKEVIDTYKNKVLHFYLPIDLPIIVNQYIKQINPSACILLEKEIWPNLIHTLNKNNIPSLLVNARLSQRSLEKYQKFTPKLVKQTLNKLSVVATQNQNSANRFIELGADTSKVIATGNIKFDQNPGVDKTISKKLKTIVGKRKVVVFASTHKGEERQIIDAYLNHKDNIDALLVIIPRHPERFNEVYKLAKKYRLNIVKRSSNKSCKDCDLLLGDSMGEMMSYFDVADIVFMGGSLNDTGGHNMLEPASLEKPIIFGPNMSNFQELANDLVNVQGAIQINSVNELFETIVKLQNDEKTQSKLGKNAYHYLKKNSGSTEKIIKIIGSNLKKKSIKLT